MKKLFYVGALSALLLAACGGEEETKPATTDTASDVEQVENQTEAPAVEEVKEEPKEEIGEVKNGPLTKAGEWTMDGNNKVTLVKIKEVNETHELGPIKFTIESVKLLNHSAPDQLTIEWMQSLHNKDVSAGLNTIQIIYSVENTIDSNVMFHAINKVTTDTKSQIEGMHDMAQSADLGSYAGQVIVEGMAIYPYFGGELEEINAINILTGDVIDSDSFNQLSDAQKITINF